MERERLPEWHMRPPVVWAVLLTALGLGLASWWLGLAWLAIVGLLVLLARYAPWLLRLLLGPWS